MTTLIDTIKKLNYRPDWAEYFMTVAYFIANRSSCERLHVGCVIVNDNRIIATGYNGHIKGAPHSSFIKDGHEQMTIHAESNAITDSASKGIKLKGSCAYVTHYPCINCAKYLIASGIQELIYAEDYNNDELCEKLYVMAGVKVNKYKPNNINNNKQLKTNFNKVVEFHKCAGHPSYEQPQTTLFNSNPERVDLRLKLIKEEFSELEDAIKSKNFTEVIDALADLLYVTYGCCAEFGIDADEAFNLVHKSNMTKFPINEIDAIQTVEWYKKQYDEGKSKYKNPAYRRSPDGNHWVIYDKDTDKALKSINYSPVNFTNLKFSHK